MKSFMLNNKDGCAGVHVTSSKFAKYRLVSYIAMFQKEYLGFEIVFLKCLPILKSFVFW